MNMKIIVSLAEPATIGERQLSWPVKIVDATQTIVISQWLNNCARWWTREVAEV
jgi:hypothetical protein